MLISGKSIHFIKYRFETCQEDLYDAKLMLENGRYKNLL